MNRCLGAPGGRSRSRCSPSCCPADAAAMASSTPRPRSRTAGDATPPDTVGEEGSLSSHIFQLRRALGEGAGGQRFIETIPKRGYRFVSPCAQLGSSAPAAGVGRLMLVVLPFENLSGGRKHDYFSEGL